MASHLSLEEREIIAHMHRAGKMQTQIADRIGRSKSTISRELGRNRPSGRVNVSSTIRFMRILSTDP